MNAFSIHPDEFFWARDEYRPRIHSDEFGFIPIYSGINYRSCMNSFVRYRWLIETTVPPNSKFFISPIDRWVSDMNFDFEWFFLMELIHLRKLHTIVTHFGINTQIYFLVAVLWCTYVSTCDSNSSPKFTPTAALPRIRWGWIFECAGMNSFIPRDSSPLMRTV